METEHPPESSIKTFVLHQWVWSKLKPTLREGCTLFHVVLIFQQDRIDPFCPLSSLTDAAVLEVSYLIRDLREPSPRVRSAIAGAISRDDAMLLWCYLSRYQMPKLLTIRRGETINPLSLLLEASPWREETTNSCPSALVALLESKCSPNELGAPRRSPLWEAVCSHDQKSVELLLAYRADANVALAGRDPPVCVAFARCMHDIASMLLQARADIGSRCVGLPPPGCDPSGYEGPGLLQLARGDQQLQSMLSLFVQDVTSSGVPI